MWPKQYSLYISHVIRVLNLKGRKRFCLQGIALLVGIQRLCTQKSYNKFYKDLQIPIKCWLGESNRMWSEWRLQRREARWVNWGQQGGVCSWEPGWFWLQAQCLTQTKALFILDQQTEAAHKSVERKAPGVSSRENGTQSCGEHHRALLAALCPQRTAIVIMSQTLESH
jgi:hypothetical protein